MNHTQREETWRRDQDLEVYKPISCYILRNNTLTKYDVLQIAECEKAFKCSWWKWDITVDKGKTRLDNY